MENQRNNSPRRASQTRASNSLQGPRPRLALRGALAHATPLTRLGSLLALALAGCGAHATGGPEAAAPSADANQTASAAASVADAPAPASAEPPAFAHSEDVGVVSPPGKMTLSGDVYELTAAGKNLWAKRDDFHFAHRPLLGDGSLQAEVGFASDAGNEHRKALLMIRDGLDTAAPYADAAIHGDGLASLQYRVERGGETHEMRAKTTGPRYARIERRGQSFSAAFSADGENWELVGPVEILMPESALIGLGACSHDEAASATMTFSAVRLSAASD